MANTITLTDKAAGRVYAGDLGSASVSVAGSYTSSGAPPAIQARVVEAGDLWAATNLYTITDLWLYVGATVVDWTTIVASPSGGVFAGTLTVPRHATWLYLQVRFADASAESDGTHQWGVGFLVLCLGQSNDQNSWLLTSGAPPTPDPRASYYLVDPGGPQWIPPAASIYVGDGMIEFMNDVVSRLNVPVGAILGSQGGAALDPAAAVPANHYWSDYDDAASGTWPTGYLFGAVRDAIAAIGGDISCMRWLQGEQEVFSAVTSKATRKTQLATFYARLRALTSRTAGQLPFHVGLIGYFTGGGASASANTDAVRAADIETALAGNGFVLGPASYDCELGTDAVHHTVAGYVQLNKRWAAQVCYYTTALGGAVPAYLVSGASPRITAVTRYGAALLITVTPPPNGQFLLDALGSNESGWKVSADNFVTTITPSYIKPKSLTQIAIVLPADPGGQVKLKYQQGQPASFAVLPVPEIGNVAYGGSNPFLDPVAMPLLNTYEPIASDDTTVTPIFPTQDDLPGLAFSVFRRPLWSTVVQGNVSGKESAIGYVSYPRYEYELNFEFLRGDVTFAEQQSLQGFFNAVAGRVRVFLFDDVDDDYVVDQFIGIGDGVTTRFKLVRTRGGMIEQVLGADFSSFLPDGVTAAGVKINAVGTATANYDGWNNAAGNAPGYLRFSPAPAAGDVLTATFFYRWPCRFTDDSMTFEKFMSELWSGKSIKFRTQK
jgi:uncharacterized protein (TIGR02217 family)